MCNDIDELDKSRIFSNSVPSGYIARKTNMVIGMSKEVSLKDCIGRCCSDEKCDSIVYSTTNEICVLYNCVSAKLCKPVKTEGHKNSNYYVILNDKVYNYYRMQSKTIHGGGIVKSKSTNNEESRNNSIVTSMKMNKMTTETIHSQNKTIETNLKSVKKSKNSNNTSSTSTKKHNETVINKKYKIKVNAGSDKTIEIKPRGYSRTLQTIVIKGKAEAINEETNEKVKLKYFWTRKQNSLSVGRIINNTDKTKRLEIIGLVPGDYHFQLNVVTEDGQGASDSMMLRVKESTPDPISSNLMEAVLETPVTKFTEKEKLNFESTLKNVIEKKTFYKNCKVYVQQVEPTLLNETRIVFFVLSQNGTSDKQELLSSAYLESKLKFEMVQHDYLVDIKIIKFQSRICYFTCDGRGKCNPVTHDCMCDFPWMTNALHQKKTGEPNCNMHLILVLLILSICMIIFLLTLMACRRIARKCRRRNHYGNDTLKYKLLEDRS